MIENFLNWREENNVDQILINFNFPVEKEVRTVYEHNYHKTDKLGRPIYIERTGRLQVERLFAMADEPTLVRHFIHSYEELVLVRFPACSEVSG